ncbi:MAG: hypothetical protein U0840_02590 [Gemmataceae bacterium]
MMSASHGRQVLLLAAALAVVPTLAWAADEEKIPSFKSRTDQEKKFVTEVCKTILKAAHFSGKERTLEKYTLDEVKKGRTKLTIKGSYKGAATGKQYLADIVVHIDSSEPTSWEVLRLEYSDNNNIPYSRKKVDELVKQFNRKE